MNTQFLNHRARLLRLPWLCLTIGSLGLGLAGAILPLVPTTPFILLATWAAPKGSPKIEVWLRQHPLFGPLLDNWHKQRAISRSATMYALATLFSSWLMLYALNYSFTFLGVMGVLFTGIAAFLLTRPIPQTRGSNHE